VGGHSVECHQVHRQKAEPVIIRGIRGKKIKQQIARKYTDIAIPLVLAYFSCLSPKPECKFGTEFLSNLEVWIIPLKISLFMLSQIHHIAIICSDYTVSKKFYTEILGLEIVREVFREVRQSFKLDLSLNGQFVLELFSFPNPPERPSHPEACGLRHLAFAVNKLEPVIEHLRMHHVEAEPIRVDEFTGKRFTFIADPDQLPIEFYEI
jgi:glyoxylase I family protein